MAAIHSSNVICSKDLVGRSTCKATRPSACTQTYHRSQWSRSPVNTGYFSSSKQAVRRRRHAIKTGASAEPSTTQQLTLELSSRDVQTNVKFAAIPLREREGKAIVVQFVASGSEAQLEGLRPGQQLLAISDPVRPDIWPLNERASLRYVRDAIRMRRGELITLVVSEDIIEEVRLMMDDSDTISTATSSSEASIISSSDDDNGLQQSNENDGGAISPTSSGSGLSIADKLEQQYDSSNRTMTAYERRMVARKERMEQVSTRNDAPFFAGLLALFLVPALGILWYASASGYLDALAAGQRY